MKKFTNQYIKWGLTALIVLILAICFVCLIFRGQAIRDGWKVLLNIVMPVIDGLVIAFIAAPVLNWIEEKLILPFCRKCRIDKENAKVKKRIRALSVSLTFLFIGVVTYSFFAVVIPQILLSIQNIYERFPVYIDNLSKLAESFLERFFADNPDAKQYIEWLLATYSADLQQYIEDFLATYSKDLKGIAGMLKNFILPASKGVIGILKSLYNLLIGLIISVYILAGKETFASQGKKICYALFERHAANQVIRAFRFTNRTFIGFLGGKIVDSAIIGVLCFIGTSAFKMPYPVLVSVIVGVTNVIPFFGPFIGAVPSMLLILMTAPGKCIPFIIFIFALQQLDGNVIGPKILGDSTGLSSFWVIFSITLFSGLWGILGMVVGVPLFAVFYAGARYMINKFLRKKTLSTDTKDYEKLDYIDAENEYISGQNTKSSNSSQSDAEKERAGE